MKTRLELEVPQEVADWLAATAAKRGITISQLVEEIIIEYITKLEATEKG